MARVFELPDGPGTYILWLESEVRRQITIGRLATLSLRPGVYLYVGSAFGPGGLRARVQRHHRRKKKARWHVDYLRAHTALSEVFYCDDAVEHLWAEELAGSPGAEIPLPRFGSSDCRCRSHLVYFRRRRDAERGARHTSPFP